MKRLSQGSLHYKVLVVLIVAASCFRILICFQHNPMNYLGSDMLRHWNNGARFPRGGYGGAADPIGYQAYIFLLQKITRDQRLLVAAASALLSILMPWTYYRAARNFGLQKVPALWVWVLIAWTPSLIVVYRFIMMETLLLLLEGIALWMTARYLRKGGLGPFLVFVFCWTLGCLTKLTLIPLAAVCFLWVWWKRATPLRDLALGAALALLLLVPQAVRSELGLGFVAPFGNPWLTRIQLRSGARTVYFRFYAAPNQRLHFTPVAAEEELLFGSPSCFIRPLEPVSHWAMRRAYGDTKAQFTINAAHGEDDWKAAYDSFNHDPNQQLAQWRENIVLFLFSPSWPESSVGEWDGHLEYRARWMWAPLILFLFTMNVREFWHRRIDLIPVATMVFTLVLALQNTAIMEGRYRKPLEAVLLLNLVWIFGKKSAGIPEPTPRLTTTS